MCIFVVWKSAERLRQSNECLLTSVSNNTICVIVKHIRDHKRNGIGNLKILGFGKSLFACSRN